MCGCRSNANHSAIWRSLGNGVGADVATCAWTVFDDDGT